MEGIWIGPRSKINVRKAIPASQRKNERMLMPPLDLVSWQVTGLSHRLYHGPVYCGCIRISVLVING